jgi:hypothetical protein
MRRTFDVPTELGAAFVGAERFRALIPIDQATADQLDISSAAKKGGWWIRVRLLLRFCAEVRHHYRAESGRYQGIDQRNLHLKSPQESEGWWINRPQGGVV